MMRKITLCIILAMVLTGCATPGGPSGKSFSKSPVASGPIDTNIPHPTKIALLLPLDGPLKNYGKAIQNGFFAAYYDSKNSGGGSPTISVVNTSGTNVLTAYNQAVASGANFIVGPLTKPEVAALAHTNLTVPTLALNALDNSQRISNLYQFGLSPLDEAYQAAQKAFQDHHQNALIIAPNSAWGRSVVAVFENHWKSLGGHVVGEGYYTNQQSLMGDVKNLLQVKEETDPNAENRPGKKVKSIPTHRQDADVIFMVATPYYGRQIRPLLRYFFAGNIPVYATSQIYSGRPNPQRDADLNGVMFCDMPWVLSPSNLSPSSLARIQQQVQTAWPDSYANNAKLYALGVDAYRVAMHLSQMAANPQSGLPSATGTLFLGQNLHLYRQLVWSKIENGQPVMISR